MSAIKLSDLGYSYPQRLETARELLDMFSRTLVTLSKGSIGEAVYALDSQIELDEASEALERIEVSDTDKLKELLRAKLKELEDE